MLFAAVSSLQAAAVITATPSVVANVAAPTVTAADVFNGMYTNMVNTNLAWLNNVYNVKIEGTDGGLPVEIQQLTALSITLSASTTGSTQFVNAGGVSFNTAPNGLVAHAYNASGTDVTGTVNGQNIFSNLTGLGITTIVVSGYEVDTSSFAGTYNIMNIGDSQTGTISATATTGGGSSVSTNFATVTAVPEPSSFVVGCLSLGAFTFVRRRR